MIDFLYLWKYSFGMQLRMCRRKFMGEIKVSNLRILFSSCQQAVRLRVLKTYNLPPLFLSP